MSRLLGGYRVTQMLHVAAALGIADRLARSPATVEHLAAQTHTHEPSLYRLLRALASLGIFTELEDRQFATTPLASTLQTDDPGGLRAFALSYGEPWWWSAFGELLHCVRTGETGFAKVHGSSLFEYLDRHPGAARTFNENMAAMTRVEADAISAAYRFEAARLVIDVGGGHGVLASAIVRRWPGTSATVFDQHSVGARAGDQAAWQQREARLSFVGGDFFEAVPSGGDAYILKDILHDWDDERARLILRNCRAVMRTDARLLVVERLVSPGNAPSIAKDIDVTMLVLTGGRERTRSEYSRLLQESGYSLDRVTELPTGACVMEAVPAEGPDVPGAM